MEKLAIIGASYLQVPLIKRAKELGCETHVFAWASGDVGEQIADCFHPISIREKDSILQVCRQIGIDGICTIASDLAAITVGYVAYELGLMCNPPECVSASTNKRLMRETFELNGDPSPASFAVSSADSCRDVTIAFPAIVKPSDRSGSRGVTKVDTRDKLEPAVLRAIDESFSGIAVVEEYIGGREYSVESISWEGAHHPLAITEKYTTGAPWFVEHAHLEPADLDGEMKKRIWRVVDHALSSLGVRCGASHAEVKVDERNRIRIIEVGARMGGDLIGSDLVRLSTGYDFLEGVISVALGKPPVLPPIDGAFLPVQRYAAVRFICDEDDLTAYRKLKRDNPEMLVDMDFDADPLGSIVSSASRRGYYLFSSSDELQLKRYLPSNQPSE